MIRVRAAGLMARALAVSPPAAADDGTVGGGRAADMVVDVVVMRPLGLG